MNLSIKIKIVITALTFLIASSTTAVALYSHPSITSQKNYFDLSDGNNHESADQSELLSLTAEVVALHNSRSDCWAIIDERIYDITKYVPFHPGGSETILSACGVDASQAFHSKGGRGQDHLASTQTLLQSYFIGALGQAPNQSKKQAESIPDTPPIIPEVLPTPDITTKLGSTLTPDTVATHNTTTSCWLIINQQIYDVTAYLPFHPGGTQQILNYCGGEATQAFNTKGGRGSGHTSYADGILAAYKIGSLGQTVTAIPTISATPVPVPILPPSTTTPPPASTSTSLDSTAVSSHNSSSSCWLIINNKVYDVTAYIPFHPGGTQQITSRCGTEATQAFNTRGGSGSHSTNANNLLANYFIGNLGSTTTSTSAGSTGTTPTPTPPTGGSTSPQAAILAVYPGATITSIETEDDGRSAVKFSYNGQSFEAKLDAQNNILKVDN